MKLTPGHPAGMISCSSVHSSHNSLLVAGFFLHAFLPSKIVNLKHEHWPLVSEHQAFFYDSSWGCDASFFSFSSTRMVSSDVGEFRHWEGTLEQLVKLIGILFLQSRRNP